MSPFNPVCLDSARLQPPQRSSEADWFVGYASNVCYSSPILPPQVQHKGPKVGGSGRDLSGSGECEAGLPSPPLPVLSYEGVLASYLPMTTEPFSCLGEEHPGVGPRYGEELLLVEVGLQGRDKERGRGVSDGVVIGSRSRSGGRSAAEGGNGKASGNPVM